MAADSSNDSSHAPQNFQISSSNEGSEINLSTNTLKCLLCSRFRKSFHCRFCVQNGDFVHSTHHLSERFSEKQLKYLNIKANLRKCNDHCVHILQGSIVCENLKTDIKSKRMKISLLNQLISETKVDINTKNKYKDSLLSKNRIRQINIPKYANKVKELEDYVGDRIQQNLKLYEQKNELHNELKKIIRHNINELLKFIFPISQNRLQDNRDKITSSTDTVTALADATNMAYVRGKWVMQHNNSKEGQYVIVAPSLPINGDYSAYSDWLAHSKDGVPNSATSEALPSTNPAYRISAALTYATQLVNILSFYLDVKLPYKLAYSDFCKKELTDQHFNRKVARLNSNILYLCYTQRIKLNTLNPSNTLENILKLLDTSISDLGRIGPVDISDASPFRLCESQLFNKLDNGTESETDEKDLKTLNFFPEDQSFRQEWETVPHLSPLEVTPAIPVQNPQQTSSMAGGLVTSIASIWRGWTNAR